MYDLYIKFLMPRPLLVTYNNTYEDPEGKKQTNKQFSYVHAESHANCKCNPLLSDFMLNSANKFIYKFPNIFIVTFKSEKLKFY